MSISPEAERQYWAASRGIGLADVSDGGRLLMKGSDSLDLLHRLTTQDLLALQPGQGATTVLTSDKGRIVDLVTCYLFPDHLLLLTSPGNSQAVLEWIDKYTIIEDAETTDVTDSTGLLRFFGPNAGRLAQRLADDEAEELPPGRHVAVSLDGMEATLANDASAAGGGFYLLLPANGAHDQAASALESRADGLGLTRLGLEAQETLRIEAGRPAFGHEIDQRFNPLEAELRSSISFDKGCYIGQEVVARLDTYKKVSKLLVGLRLPDAPQVERGAKLHADGKERGFVTSVGYSPALQQPIALAYVRTAYATPGTTLSLGADDEAVQAEVAALPFTPGG